MPHIPIARGAFVHVQSHPEPSPFVCRIQSNLDPAHKDGLVVWEHHTNTNFKMPDAPGIGASCDFWSALCQSGAQPCCCSADPSMEHTSSCLHGVLQAVIPHVSAFPCVVAGCSITDFGFAVPQPEETGGDEDCHRGRQPSHRALPLSQRHYSWGTRLRVDARGR